MAKRARQAKRRAKQDVNQVELLGTVESTQYRVTQNGHHLKVRLHTSHYDPTDDQVHSAYHSVSFWGDLAQEAAQELRAGQRLWVRGRLQYWRPGREGSFIASVTVTEWTLE